ncbi:MAG: hypothetical protein QNJ51_12450 [Calothrix sp. MO_167.B12]|nr:hypothetical protein [Calothrix sp. MO_167.B12]
MLLLFTDLMSRIAAPTKLKINGKLKKVTDAAVAFKSLGVKGVQEPTNLR